MCLHPFHVSDSEGGAGRGRTYGEEPFLISEDGNRKTNFAGCVNEQFEITNVTGTLHGLDTQIGISTHRYNLETSPNKTTYPDSKS